MTGASFYLVVHADGKLHGGTFDRAAALQRAELARGVVLEVPVIADLRGDELPHTAFADGVDALGILLSHDEPTADDPGRAGEG